MDPRTSQWFQTFQWALFLFGVIEYEIVVLNYTICTMIVLLNLDCNVMHFHALIDNLSSVIKPRDRTAQTSRITLLL